jgi:hypothetical protein
MSPSMGEASPSQAIAEFRSRLDARRKSTYELDPNRNWAGPNFEVITPDEITPDVLGVVSWNVRPDPRRRVGDRSRSHNA